MIYSLSLLLILVGLYGVIVSRNTLKNVITTPEQAYFTLFSGGTIPLSNIGLGLKVASSLFLVFTVLAAFRLAIDATDKDEDEP